MIDFERKKAEILGRVDILALVSEHVTLRRSGRRWVGLCPFHSEKTPSFTVSPDRAAFKCFGCGKGGDIFSFVQLRENVTFTEALRMLADRAGIVLESSSAGDRTRGGRADLIQVNAWASSFFRRRLQHPEIGRSARAYVQKRGISAETEERFQLGLAVSAQPDLVSAARREGFDVALLEAADFVRRSEDGRHYETFRDRLMFPIRDATGRVIGFGGRTLVEDRAKYLNTRQNALFDKGGNLYGIDLAREAAAAAGRFVVVEGYTDCLACHQAGLTHAVATLGTALTDAQVSLMRRYTGEVTLLFDSDDAGEAAAERAVRVAIPQCMTVRLAHLPYGKDPSEYLEKHGISEFSDVLNGAIEALEFTWRTTQRRYAGESSDGRRREAVVDFLRIVAEAAEADAVDAIHRGLLVNQVAHLLRMRREEVDGLMRRLGSRRVRRAESTRGSTAELPSAAAKHEQAVWTTLLEVLLNEPGLASQWGTGPDVTRLQDERDRRIVQTVLTLVDELGEFHLTDVLARFRDADDLERIITLAERGAGRGNYARTFAVALEKLNRTAQDAEDVAGESTGMRDVAARTGFVPRRLARRAVTPVGADLNGTSQPVVEKT